MCVYGMKICPVNDENTGVRVVRHAQTDCRQAAETALGSSAGMVLLSQLKGRCLITLSTGPHRKDDSDPYIGKCPYGNGMAFALRSFALIGVFGPRFTLSCLPRKLMQGVAQRFHAAQPTMRFGRLCCKNCGEMTKCVKRFILFSLNGHSKECGNQSHLASHLSFVHALHLSFPHHVHDLIALQRSPCCLK
jgi:hypothetical protein